MRIHSRSFIQYFSIAERCLSFGIDASSSAEIPSMHAEIAIGSSLFEKSVFANALGVNTIFIASNIVLFPTLF